MSLTCRMIKKPLGYYPCQMLPKMFKLLPFSQKSLEKSKYGITSIILGGGEITFVIRLFLDLCNQMDDFMKSLSKVITSMLF